MGTLTNKTSLSSTEPNNGGDAQIHKIQEGGPCYEGLSLENRYFLDENQSNTLVRRDQGQRPPVIMWLQYLCQENIYSL